MINITKEEYIKNPCKTSSLPFWKSKITSVPDNMKIIHNDDFDYDELNDYCDEPYFRLKHDLRKMQSINIPDGFSITNASISDFVKHINSCYDDVNLSISELKKYKKRAVYRPELWIAIKDNTTDKIVASGIAEFDDEIGEGILEWIQVSENYRGQKLGQSIVNELVERMNAYADFITVSGKINNPAKPEILYRKCGFEGNDIWHILFKN